MYKYNRRKLHQDLNLQKNNKKSKQPFLLVDLLLEEVYNNHNKKNNSKNKNNTKNKNRVQDQIPNNNKNLNYKLKLKNKNSHHPHQQLLIL